MSSNEELLRLLGEDEPMPAGPFVPRTRRCLLGFRFSSEGNAFYSHPYLTFRPCGLLIWNPPPLSTVSCVITGQNQLVASFEPVPAQWFATAKSFEQLAAEVAEGKEPPAWCTFSVVEPGQTIEIAVQSGGVSLSPADQVELVMWGRCVVR